MNATIKILTVLLLLNVVAIPSFGQYFNKLHDYDSTNDWGWDVFQRSDNNYFVIGTLQAHLTKWDLPNMIISSDGNAVLDKHILKYSNSHVYCGDPGAAKQLTSGGYVGPVTIQTPNTSYLNSAAGIIKLDEAGDTVFVKLYTDTSVYFDRLLCCALMPSGGFLLGGQHGKNIPSKYPGILMRTDNSGDTIWTKTYQKISTQFVNLRTVIPLNDGRIVVGASSTYTYTAGGNPYYHYTPWFMVLDSAGNILKDTLYGAKYGGEGNIYKDIGGGYIHYGWIDTLYDPTYAADIRNFPYYVAHLDTNFRIEWIHRLPYEHHNSRRVPFQIKQLQDSTFLVIGDDNCDCYPAYTGWAEKLSRSGEEIWSCNYWTDSSVGNFAYLRDMVELPDGNMVFVGSATHDTLPVWHASRDVWIFGTDSSGCIIPGCLPPIYTPEIKSTNNEFAIYPNPTTGKVTVNSAQAGDLVICNLQGQVVTEYKLKSGATDIQLPTGISAGMYVCRFISETGDKTPVVIRLVYRP